MCIRDRNVTLNGILIWCLVGAAGYLLRVACHGISTILAHISAYTILEGINPPATLRMAQNTERAIFPLHGAAKENRIFTQLSFCCFITITFLRCV